MTPNVEPGNAPSVADLFMELWTVVGNIYVATKGQCRIAVVAPTGEEGVT